MTCLDIFSFPDYLAIIRAAISDNAGVRGYKARLAESAGFQKTYLTLILKGTAHLTPDHAIGLCRFWHLTDEETDYFFLLLHKARAGTPALRRHYEDKITKIHHERRKLANSIKAPPAPELATQSFYYADWRPSAIHMLLAIPGFSRASAIAQRLQLRESEVEDILENLCKWRLVRRSAGGFQVDTQTMHVNTESPFSRLHHMNWLLKSLESAARREESSLHFTNVFSLSSQDFERIRADMLTFIQKARATIAASPEETAGVMTLNLFQL